MRIGRVAVDNRIRLYFYFTIVARGRAGPFELFELFGPFELLGLFEPFELFELFGPFELLELFEPFELLELLELKTPTYFFYPP